MDDHQLRYWPITILSIGWVMGTAWHLELTALQSLSVYAAWLGLGSVLCLGLVGCRLRRRRSDSPALTRSAVLTDGLWLATMCLAASQMAYGLAGWRAASQFDQRLRSEWEGVDLVLEGVIDALPQRLPESLRFRFRVERARLLATTDAKDQESADVSSQLPPRMLLGWYAGGSSDDAAGVLPDLRAGDRWRLPVRLKAPHGQLNPHGFDLEAWMWEQGLQAIGQVRLGSRRANDDVPRRLAEAVAHPVERWRQACRDQLWTLGLDARLSGILAALLLGDQAAIDPVDWDVFRRTGVAHLMSISGLHITLLAGVVRWLVTVGWSHARWRRRSWCLYWPAPTVGQWGGLLAALGYGLFSGWGLPAQRTVIMLALMVLLRGLGGRWPGPPTWLMACALVLAWDPWAWLQASFWLSFVAVGLLMATDAGSVPSSGDASKGASGLPLGEISRSLKSLTDSMHRLWREQWVMTVCLAPLTLLLFREVSVVGVLANLLAIPWVTLVVTPLALAGVAWPDAWTAGAWALMVLQSGLVGLLAWGVPSWSVAAFPWWVGLAGVLGAVLLWRPGPLWLRGWGAPCLVPVMTWQTPGPAHGDVSVLVADVGQGQAVLVRTAHHAMLYDAGPRYSREADAGQRVVVPLLQSWQIRLDLLVLSHRDVDHTGGAAAVSAMQPHAVLMGSLPRSHPIAQAPGFQDCEAGTSWEWDGVRFEVLHPDPEGEPSRGTSNAWSCVLRIQTNHSSLLLAGDIEAAEELSLVQKMGAALKTDVLLAPHHGSRTSSTDVFLSAVGPHTVWVQAGYRNRYGHPAREVMARYRIHGIAVLETARCGAIHWSSVEPDKASCERALRRRYWHHTVPRTLTFRSSGSASPVG